MHHAINWLLHLANTLLLFLLFRFLFPQTQRAALIAAGLFAIHPQAVESYAWMSERKNVLYSFFLLSSALSYGRYLRCKQPRWWLIALLLFGLSLLSKAQAMSLLPLLFLIDWREGRSLRERKLYVDKLPFLLLVVAMLLLSWQVQSSTWASDKLVNNSGLERFFIASWALLRYFGGAVLPLGLSPFPPYPGASGMELQFYHYAAALVWPVLGFALWHSWRKNALLFFSLSFFLIHLFLLLKFVPYPHGNYYLAHRYNYLPLAGLMLGLAYLWLHYGRWRPWALSLAALYVMGLMHLSRGELAVWQNNQSLWSRVIERYPGYGQAYNMSALAHLQKGENQAAVKQWRRQLAVDPQASDAYYKLALLYLNKGEAQKTLAIIDQGFDQIGQELSTYALRIEALGKLKRREEALALAEEALARWPEKHQFVKYKSQALSGMGRYQEAYDYFAPGPGPKTAPSWLLWKASSSKKTLGTKSAKRSLRKPRKP